MTVREQIERLWANLLKLGTKRLITLAVVGVSVFAMTGLAGYFLSRPALEVLYSGLDRQDVSRIASALKEADIPFDVNADGNSVLVRFGETARARMLLAEKGLPNSPNAGNELFDKLGSLGLTSFMQEVTRVRALEGELARTIQLMHGVKAARVHIVMPDEGSFRRTRQPPSASVVVRMESNDDPSAAKAIRHLVASAVPGMTVEEVTVLNTEGVLLASGADTVDGAPSGMIMLEKAVSREIIDNIRKTLTPYLGLRNFQISVAARLNTDKRQTNETIYNPDSKVERSIHVTRQNQNSQNSTVQSPTSVERNLPQENARSDDGKQSTEESQKRDELTNYEISSKVVNTVSGGYGIDNLSVAVLVNRASLISSLGEKPTPDALAKQMNEIEMLVASAAGAHKERGDIVKISAVDFIDPSHELEPQPPPSIGEMFLRQSTNLVNAATILVVAILLIWFGLRPATKAILANTRSTATAIDLRDEEEFQALEDDDAPPALPVWSPPSEPNLIEDLTSTPRHTPQKRLEQIVEYDEQQAAAVLKQWIHQGEEV
ncbi:flagellar basal-body MS-ring/collar protein FliF [Beijerinckia indica]|uniref:Flagellar M-ring protein n=1 Tax=Beijerinckia indica subsp. indica (strain ATCC 9039 / DSM 1715 / NCIMB 8712) TaxID=395963 RepID=B2IJE8_BEII9|nr:flagellar basal-body MS-ring/collar protein FliF [Beijerinckia indica]ACB96261.1 flagellar M-ring protein FliF [Beijerinckia indica subsp. indica ATCC 9039]